MNYKINVKQFDPRCFPSKENYDVRDLRKQVKSTDVDSNKELGFDPNLRKI